MPSLFSAVWEPHKKEASAKAKNVARSLSFTGKHNADGTVSAPRKSASLDPAATSPTSPNGHHAHLNRAEQKALKQKAKSASSVNVPPSKRTSLQVVDHPGQPIVGLGARFGYLEHSGRGLHIEADNIPREPLSAINEQRIGDRVFFRARIHGTRALSAKLAFVLFRDGIQIIQGVIRVTNPTAPNTRPTSPLSRSSSTGTHSSSADPSSSNAVNAVKEHGAPASPVDIHDQGVTVEMVRWAEKLPLETLVLVEGRVQSPASDSGGEHEQVKSANVHGAEIEVIRLLVLSQVTHRTPFAVAQAAQPVAPAVAVNEVDDKVVESTTTHHHTHPETDSKSSGSGSKTAGKGIPHVGFHSQLEHRALALRTPSSHAIFRLVAAFSRAARSYLDERDFTEIHSAKLQQGATESGASVFHVDYFRRTATLAQSPQLAKEMAIGADFGRVYEIGPVFRAEQSNTHRHLCEFTGLDVEMAIDHDYHEAMELIDGMLKHIFRTVQERNRKEIEAVKQQFPSDDLVFPDKTVVLRFDEGVRMLRESGYLDEGEDESALQKGMEDLTTRGEVRLGQLVKEKYNTDYYILDKFPAAVRPFYTMPDADDPTYSNSFDIFVRGEEILSGGQRLHSAPALEAALEAKGIAKESMREYLEAFQFAMPPHAGGGIGLERLVMLFLKLGNIRHATFIPRDPKSFPTPPPGSAAAQAQLGVRLPVPSGVAEWAEPNVLAKDPLFNPEAGHPRLEDLIAKYGDSTNTAWTDAGYEIWRHAPTGYAIGFVAAKGHAVTWGAPLCPPEAMSEVVRAYTAWASKERKLGVIWANADARTEGVLVKEHKWRALAVTSEQRLEPAAVDKVGQENKHLEKKVHQAIHAGVTVKMVQGEISTELRKELEDGMHRWLEGRSGAQIHTTSLRPWSDVEHRTYFVARDKEHKACGIIVLQQLAPEHGFQIKWSLMFPGAPNGTSELLVTTAMRELAQAGVPTATFGAGAKDTFEAVNGIGNLRGKILADVYKGISRTFGLTRKSHFREQFGAKQEALYICYPAHGLGLSGINAIMESVKTQDSA